MSDAPKALEFPRELTQPVREVLSLMIFNTGRIAALYRQDGHDIAKKIEDEQAFVLHRFLCLALTHGDAWRHVASAEFNEMLKRFPYAVEKPTAEHAEEAEKRNP